MTSVSERDLVLQMVAAAVVDGASQHSACEAISLSERTLQRWKNDQAAGGADRRPARVQTPGNRLSELERQNLLEIANSPEFGHLSPSQIVPRLVDRGVYVASESTFYRVLKEENQLKHRGAENPSKPRGKPRALFATAPDQLYSWDITYLPTRVKGIYYYLYLFMDVFSRKVVGWQIYETESAELASEVMRDICMRGKIAPNQVVLHSDNGSPMRGATMQATLKALGVVPSFSRPAVSNDNPFSESLFKTLKYRPSYPSGSFANLMAARQWVGSFVHWYNNEHRHSAIGFVTPAQRHDGLDSGLLAKRAEVYEAARNKRPERWSGPTRNWTPVSIVHLNPEKTSPKENKLDKGPPALLKKAA